jgi:hypothetical protein
MNQTVIILLINEFSAERKLKCATFRDDSRLKISAMLVHILMQSVSSIVVAVEKISCEFNDM